MPYDWEVGGEDAAEGLEGRVGAKGDEGPCEIWGCVAEDDSQADGGDGACSVKKSTC